MAPLFFLSMILHIANICGQDDEKLKPIDPIPVDPILLCDYADEQQCAKDQSCWWDPKYNCGNKLNCSQIPLEKCEGVKFCNLIKPTVGFCSGPPPHCSSLSIKQCVNDVLCSWVSSQQCIPKDPMPPFPNCASFDPLQCQKNAEYCNLSGTCYDNKKFCAALTYDQCIEDPACKYMWTQKEQCLDNPKYCTGLSEKECLKNKDFCFGLSTIPQCVNSFNCNGLSYDECKKNYNQCSIAQTPFQCSPKKNKCSLLTTPDQCKAAGCLGSFTSDGIFQCTYPHPCSQFDEEKCKANPQICDYTPGTFQCQNNFDCNQISDPEKCKLTKQCQYIPSVFQCVSKKQNCPKLFGDDCKKNPACIYVPAQGQCTQISTFGCDSLNIQDCYKNKHCLLKYACTPKKLLACNSLSLEDCKKSSYCQLIDKGQCYDNKYNCDLPYEKCIFTKPCVWNAGQDGQCVNELECGDLSEEECKKAEDICNLSVGGCKPYFRK